MYLGRLVVGGIVAAMVSGAVSAQEVGSPASGRRLAERLCAECHNVQPDAPRSASFGAPSFVTVAAVPGMTATALFATLQTSHRTMPNVMLGADEKSDIIAYILSLRPAVPTPSPPLVPGGR
jgi:mono/diheme cytochrome c family protein